MSNESESEVKENPIGIINTTITHHHETNDHDDVVFPPFNHENLPLQKPTIIISTTPSPNTPPTSTTRDVALRWARHARSRLVSFLRSFKDSKWLNTSNIIINNDNSRWFGCGVAITATVLVWWFYVRRRRRKGRMVLAIREKDEKIKQLLHQIAQMNQLLLSLHKSSLSQGGGVT